MEEKKLTDKEIIKALECCLDRELLCEECPLHNNFYPCLCMNKLKKYSLDLIHRLQSENERLTEENAELYKEHTTLIAGSILERQDIAKYPAKEIFEKIFEVLCCFTTQGKSREYNEGYIQCLEEIDKRIQGLAQKYGVEVK